MTALLTLQQNKKSLQYCMVHVPKSNVPLKAVILLESYFLTVIKALPSVSNDHFANCTF